MAMRWRGCAGKGLAALLAFAAPAAWTTVADEPAADGAEAPGAQEEQSGAPPENQRDAADRSADKSAAAPLDVDTILSNPLGEDAYRERRSCLRTRGIDRVEILNDTLVLFHVRRNKAWLNQLSSRCRGLERDMIVNLRIYGGSICRMDTFRGLTRTRDFMPAAHCRLGDFEVIESRQIEALRTALEEERQAAKLARKARRAERRERRRARRE